MLCKNRDKEGHPKNCGVWFLYWVTHDSSCCYALHCWRKHAFCATVCDKSLLSWCLQCSSVFSLHCLPLYCSLWTVAGKENAEVASTLLCWCVTCSDLNTEKESKKRAQRSVPETNASTCCRGQTDWPLLLTWAVGGMAVCSKVTPTFSSKQAVRMGDFLEARQLSRQQKRSLELKKSCCTLVTNYCWSKELGPRGKTF